MNPIVAALFRMVGIGVPVRLVAGPSVRASAIICPYYDTLIPPIRPRRHLMAVSFMIQIGNRRKRVAGTQQHFVRFPRWEFDADELLSDIQGKHRCEPHL